jgi:cytochrome c oxidase cbb3-type subunit IV
MTLDNVFNNASSIITVVSFVTFIGIMLWTCSARRTADFNAAAQLPFADEDYAGDDQNKQVSEKHNG